MAIATAITPSAVTRIGVLSHPTTVTAASRVVDELHNVGGRLVQARLVPDTELASGARLGVDGLVTYTGAMINDDALAALRVLEADGMPVLNGSDSIVTSRDKWLSYKALDARGVSSPTTVRTHGRDAAIAGLTELGLPRVMKLPVGTEGKEVALARTLQDAEDFAGKFGDDESWLLQDLITPMGEDVRVVVTPGPHNTPQAIAAMMRSSDQFSANISAGGVGTVHDLHPDDAITATRATSALGLDFAGIDLMGPSGKMQVIEGNSGLGLHVETVTGVNVAREIAAAAITRTTRGA